MLQASRALRELAWILIAQVAIVGMGLIGLKLLTNMLTPRSYGEFALALTIAGGLSTVLYGPLSQVGLRFAAAAVARGMGNDLLTWLRKTYLRMTIGSGLIVATVGAALALFGYPHWAFLSLAGACVGFGAGATAVVASSLNALRQRRTMAIIQVSDAFARPLLIVVALAVIYRSSEVAIAGGGIAAWLVALASYRKLRNALHGGNSRSYTSSRGTATLTDDMKKYLRPFVLFGLMSVIGLYGDRWVLQSTVGAHEVGLYAVMFQVASAPVVIVLGVLNQFAYPIVFASAGSGEAHAFDEANRLSYRKYLFASAALIGAISAAAYMYGDAVVTAVASQDYAEHHELLWILVIGLAMFHFAQQMTVLGFSARQPSAYFWPKLLHSLCFVAAALPLGTYFGIRGVAAAVMVSSAVYLLLIWQANTALEMRAIAKRTQSGSISTTGD